MYVALLVTQDQDLGELLRAEFLKCGITLRVKEDIPARNIPGFVMIDPRHGGAELLKKAASLDASVWSFPDISADNLRAALQEKNPSYGALDWLMFVLEKRRNLVR